MTFLLVVMLAITPAEARGTHDAIGAQLAPGIKMKLATMAKSLRGAATLNSIASDVRMAFPEKKLTTADIDVLSFFLLQEAITYKEQEIESIRARGQAAPPQALQTAIADKNSFSNLLTMLTNLPNMRHEMLKAVANNLRA